jgi:hypothetical protein
LVEGGADANGLDGSRLDAKLCGIAARDRESEGCEQSKGNRQRRYELPRPRHFRPSLKANLAHSVGSIDPSSGMMKYVRGHRNLHFGRRVGEANK